MNLHRFNYLALVIVIILVSSIDLKAQDDTQYLFDLKKYKLTGFGNTNHDFSIVDGTFGVTSGGSGAFLFDYKFFVGIYSRSLTTNHYREDIYSESYDPDINPNESPIFNGNKLRFEHGGLWIGYVYNPNKLLHFGANLQLGTGKIALLDKDVNYYDFEEHHRDVVGVFTPEINIELNLARWFKVNMGVGYRLVTFVDNKTYVNKLGESLRLYNPNQFSSPVASIKLMFGVFGPKKNGENKIEDNH